MSVSERHSAAASSSGARLCFCIALKNSRMEAAFFHAPHLRQQLPRPADRLFLEVIAERPVAEHLEKGVVIGVLAHIIEIVVFAAGPDALLRIDRALVGPRPVPRKTSLN